MHYITLCINDITQDGRLSRGDQLLAINSQSLLGRSNAEALDTLRKALTMATDSGSKIKLVIARKTGSNKKQPGMAALEESPIEVEKYNNFCDTKVWYLCGYLQNLKLQQLDSVLWPFMHAHVHCTFLKICRIYL